MPSTVYISISVQGVPCVSRHDHIDLVLKRISYVDRSSTVLAIRIPGANRSR